jgi:hypothetical protein
MTWFQEYFQGHPLEPIHSSYDRILMVFFFVFLYGKNLMKKKQKTGFPVNIDSGSMTVLQRFTKRRSFFLGSDGRILKEIFIINLRVLRMTVYS